MSAQRMPVHPLVALGLVVLALGGIASVWLWDWRYVVTGALVGFVLVVLAAVSDRSGV